MNKQSLFIKTALVAAVAFGVTACVTDTCNLDLGGVSGSLNVPQTGSGAVVGSFSTTTTTGTTSKSPTASCGTINPTTGTSK